MNIIIQFYREGTKDKEDELVAEDSFTPVSKNFNEGVTEAQEWAERRLTLYGADYYQF